MQCRARHVELGGITTRGDVSALGPEKGSGRNIIYVQGARGEEN
jgi:hypothetical protein